MHIASESERVSILSPLLPCRCLQPPGPARLQAAAAALPAAQSPPRWEDTAHPAAHGMRTWEKRLRQHHLQLGHMHTHCSPQRAWLPVSGAQNQHRLDAGFTVLNNDRDSRGSKSEFVLDPDHPETIAAHRGCARSRSGCMHDNCCWCNMLGGSVPCSSCQEMKTWISATF